METPAPRRWIGKTLRELNVRAKLGVNIIAIRRNGRINVAPGGDFFMEDGDVIVVLGDTDSLTTVQNL